MKRYIRCFAENKKDLEMQLSSCIDLCVEHMLYVLLFPTSPYVSHWEQEVYSFFSRSPKLKGTNKFPTKRQIILWTSDKRRDVITDKDYMKVLIETCCEVESYSNIYDTDAVIRQFEPIFTGYFEWLSGQLSTVGIISPASSHEKLRELYETIDFSELTISKSFDAPVKV